MPSRRILRHSLIAATILCGRAWAADPLAAIGVGAPPPPPAVQPVTETIFGQKVTDTYRDFEKLGPSTIDWMKAQGAYTRKVFDAIGPLPALQKRVADFVGSFGSVSHYMIYGGRAFYLERAPHSDNFDLMTHDASGTRKLIDVAALRSQHGGTPYAINFIVAAPDGKKIAVGISSGGSENADLSIIDAVSGKTITGPITRAEFGVTSWLPDSSGLYFDRLQETGPADAPEAKFANVSLNLLKLDGSITPLYGARQADGPKFTAFEVPVLTTEPGASTAILASQNGVQNEQIIWTAPESEVGPKTHWTRLAGREDGVTGTDARGDEIFLLSHKGAPTFQVLGLKVGQTLADAKVLVPGRPDRVVEAIGAAADGLYVLTRDGSYSHLLRVPTGSTTAEEIALPVRGHAGGLFTDPTTPGCALSVESWVQPQQDFRYDPTTKRFEDLHLSVRGTIDPNAYLVSELTAPAKDGAHVPLSEIRPKSAHGAIPTVIEAYGSYGVSETADFSPRRSVMMNEGIGYAVCHVRGGGELGEAWRLGGKDANKHNTWQDLIACGRELVRRGETKPDRLFILGGSAGGITMGRAMEDAPKLFAGVIDIVPAANTLRAQFSPNGPTNTMEFGDVTNKTGARNLAAMDTVLHVKKGVTYPAVLISTGLNDPRVSPWEPAKFAAALQTSGTPNPVLLRVDGQAGHGIGSTATQANQLSTDWIAFVFWRSGRPGWRPDAH